MIGVHINPTMLYYPLFIRYSQRGGEEQISSTENQTDETDYNLDDCVLKVVSGEQKSAHQ